MRQRTRRACWCDKGAVAWRRGLAPRGRGWWYLSVTPGLEAKRDEYRDWGWQSFLAMDAQLKVAHGHASLRDVTRSPKGGRGGLADRMESFWIAETLKYLYLLQADKNPLPLDAYVFNTEAHPFSIHTF